MNTESIDTAITLMWVTAGLTAGAVKTREKPPTPTIWNR